MSFDPRHKTSCKSCGAPIVFVRAAATGKLMPVNWEPDPDRGNVEMVDGKAVVHAQPPLLPTGDLYLSHFASCPSAAEHRGAPKPAPSTDQDSARARRDEGMRQVEENADDEWVETAYDTLVDYLRGHAEFFVDDFWEATDLEPPREARALGPVVLRASRRKLMRKSGRSRPSVRSNLSDKPIWESLIFQQPATRTAPST